MLSLYPCHPCTDKCHRRRLVYAVPSFVLLLLLGYAVSAPIHILLLSRGGSHIRGRYLNCPENGFVCFTFVSVFIIQSVIFVLPFPGWYSTFVLDLDFYKVRSLDLCRPFDEITIIQFKRRNKHGEM